MIHRSTALGVASAALLIAATAAHAAGSQTETKVADAGGPQVHAAAGTERDEDATCSRSRRRLWIEGEGWVVRRITTCR